MRRTRRLFGTALAAAVATVTAAAPAARAHDEFGFRVGRTRVAVAIGGHTKSCTYEPARYETRVVRTVVRDGYWRTVVVPAEHRWRWSWAARRFVRVCVRAATATREWVPPVVEERTVRVLVRGGWTCRGHDDC